MTIDWLSSFPMLENLEEPARKILENSTQQMTVPAGTVLFSTGMGAENYVLVLEGKVKVQMTSESGREIVLYRVAAGETCVLTTACLLAHHDYAAEGVTESVVRAVVLPSSAFRELLGVSEIFRDFVFSAYGTRIADLMLLVEEVAFQRIDLRLAKFLLEEKDERNEIRATHQEIAVELGTAREVVSRQLKEFERKGRVETGRGFVHLTDVKAIEMMAESHAF